MKRRDFLKLVAATPLVGLAAEAKTAPTVKLEPKWIKKEFTFSLMDVSRDDPVGIALEDVNNIIARNGGWGHVRLLPNEPVREEIIADLLRPNPFFKEMMRNT